MPGLVPGIHALLYGGTDVDGRDKPGHDEIYLRRLASASFYRHKPVSRLAKA